MLYCPRSGSNASHVKSTLAMDVPKSGSACRVFSASGPFSGMKSGTFALIGRLRPRNMTTCPTECRLMSSDSLTKAEVSARFRFRLVMIQDGLTLPTSSTNWVPCVVILEAALQFCTAKSTTSMLLQHAYCRYLLLHCITPRGNASVACCICTPIRRRSRSPIICSKTRGVNSTPAEHFLRFPSICLVRHHFWHNGKIERNFVALQ